MIGQTKSKFQTNPLKSINIIKNQIKKFMPSTDLIETLKEHKNQLFCIGAASICFHIIQYLRKNNKKQHHYQPQEFLQDPPSIKFDLSTRKVIYDKKHLIPKQIVHSEHPLLDQIKFLYHPACTIQKVPHLIQLLNLKQIPHIKSPLIGSNIHQNIFGGQGFLPEEAFIYKGSYVLEKNMFNNDLELAESKKWLLAGPRKFLHFKPSEIRAAIVTCGGLCPGLNVVIRQIFVTLTITYGCKEVWGVHFGFKGFYSGEEFWEKLDLTRVKELQYIGGTILGSSRGGFDSLKSKIEQNNKKPINQRIPQDQLIGDESHILDAIVKKGINQVYIIGGDGTHRGIQVLCEQMAKRKLQICFIGIPKTIDNDIPIIDKSFGFETAVSQSIKSIRSAYVQSVGVDYGMGLVRLMGRNAGFIAMEATNSSRDVDVCLIPEFKFDLEGKFGVLEYIYQQLKVKTHLVIVVAEGAGQAARDTKQLQQAISKDASQNVKTVDIGEYLKKKIPKYCDERAREQRNQYEKALLAFNNGKTQEKPVNPKTFIMSTLKYIDPAYMIRTVPANSYDRKLCAHLASSAVHGAMAGYTNFTVGHINGTPAMIPITSLGKPNRVDQSNRAWQRLLAQTCQPCFLN